MRSTAVHDELDWIGGHQKRQLVWLVQVLHHGKWYCYLRNEVDAERLPVHYLDAMNNWGELGQWQFQACRDPQLLG